MKKIAFICFLTVLVFNGAWSLDWSLGFLSDNAGANDGSFARPIPLQNGNEFTLYINSDAPAYCYIIARDSENNAYVLHNAMLQKDEKLIVGPLEITPPEGQELFYVIMSTGPQKNLEARIRAFELNETSRAAADDLVNEVLSIRREISLLKESPEMPVFMGGSFRGEESEAPEPKGVKYSGTECYVKNIIVRH
jgi:hypothetical protein